MKRLKHHLLIITALLSFATASQARTIIVHVNPSTWAIVDIYWEWNGHQWLSWDNFNDLEVGRQDYYGNWQYRRYTGGYFDYVVIERSDNQQVLQAFYANNLFYINRTAQHAYACSTGYNGSGDGTNGEVVTAASLSRRSLDRRKVLGRWRI